MNEHLVIVVGKLDELPTQVRFPNHDQVVEALLSMANSQILAQTER
jgi:hypothetical protein